MAANYYNGNQLIPSAHLLEVIGTSADNGRRKHDDVDLPVLQAGLCAVHIQLPQSNTEGASSVCRVRYTIPDGPVKENAYEALGKRRVCS